MSQCIAACRVLNVMHLMQTVTLLETVELTGENLAWRDDFAV